MRYFLTKLTFNNHFDWLYVGNRKFCVIFKKMGFENKIKLKLIINRLLFSVFYGDLNYISVCSCEGF
jgi:hypothetical protein